jgi:DNA invertase Pin-like site-specific DNA recombinase
LPITASARIDKAKRGLGLEAQRDAVMQYLNGGRWTSAGEFTEIESGKRNDRPETRESLAACKKQKAKLVIAKSIGWAETWLSLRP